MSHKRPSRASLHVEFDDGSTADFEVNAPDHFTYGCDTGLSFARVAEYPYVISAGSGPSLSFQFGWRGMPRHEPFKITSTEH